ncbi:MAG: hypothetical protein EBR81_06690 [Proteobacteria bacterium]|nr:hypothetical protein [Pseudomonadota bacterium]
MSRSLPSAALLLVSPLLLVFSGCDTIYSNNYSYQKTKFMVVKDSAGNNQIKSSYTFQPYEQQALARAEVDRQRGEAERLSLAARNSEKVNADRMATDSPALKLDSGLGGLPPVGAGGMGGSSSIPGLDSMSSGASSMSSGSIPGLDSSMSGSSMSGSSMSGSAPAPATTMGGGMMGASMDGGMSSGATPAPASAPKPAAPAMLPGL